MLSLFSSSTQSLAGEEKIFRKRAVSMKNLAGRTAPSADKVNTLPVDGRVKYATVSKRHSDENQRGSVFAIFQTEKKRDSADDAMARLDAQLAKIRGELCAMRTEGVTMGQRVANVSAGVDAVVSRHSSLEMIEESVDSSTTTTTTKNSTKGSTISLISRDSKRDSGFIYDPAFEMIDPHKYCLPNNVKSSSLPSSKKCRSTTALDFIRNDLHDDQGARLKATSIDRISCYSDSAVLTMSVYGRHY